MVFRDIRDNNESRVFVLDLLLINLILPLDSITEIFIVLLSLLSLWTEYYVCEIDQQWKRHVHHAQKKVITVSRELSASF